jgi:DNA-binding transcriptional MerR regulator
MAGYSIHYLEQLTGIKAHTLRIWEQRYNLLQPDRNAAKVRTYNDEDLKRILSVSTLIHAGYKISEVVALPENEIQKRIQEIQQSTLDSETTDYAIVNTLIEAAMTYDEMLFESIYKKAIQRNGMEHTFLYIIHPLLVRIGTLWNIDQLIPSQEHFISNLVRKKLFAAINDCKNPFKEETWILFLPENEDHEIGLLFATFLLRYYGKKVIYLGQKVPLSNIASALASTKADGILSFQVVNTTEEFNLTYCNAINALSVKQKILCAHPFVYKKEDLKTITNITSPADFIHWIKKQA